MGTSRIVWTALALALLVVSGCEARVSLGATCELSTDCPLPFVCRSGRCRTECREARDCAFPLECIQDSAGNGGCRVTEDGACPRGTIDCAEGLTCVGGRCAQPCTDHDQCAAAQRCSPEGCGRIPTESGCDVLSGAGCSDGQRCTPLGCVELVAGEVRSGELFGSCSATAPCREGLTCAAGRCLRWCGFDAEGTPATSCGTASRCASSDTTGGDPPPAGLGYCTQPCDPTRTGVAAGCPSEMNCGVAIWSDPQMYAVCEPRAARDGARWQPCSNQQCAEGLDCVHSIYAVGACLAYCESDGDCMTGLEACDMIGARSVVDHLGATRRIGVCIPTCDEVLDCPAGLPGPLNCDTGSCLRG